jgi:uncharacterized protein (TIGR03437 family)
VKFWAGPSVIVVPISFANCTIVALLCVYTAFAQGFSQLVTNRDGSVLYFSSPLRIKGSNQYFHPKIFTWDRLHDIRLYQQRAPDVPFPTTPEGGSGTHFFSLVAPDVSADGATVAVTGISFCNFSEICVIDLEEYQSTIYTKGLPTLTAPGSASLSRNGRYALLRSSVNIAGFAPSKMQLLDLHTGQKLQYEGAWLQPGEKHQVANDGTVVVAGPESDISLGQGGQLRMIVPAPSTIPLDPNPVINDTGTLVIYQAGGAHFSGSARLSAYSVPAGSSIDLITDSTDSPGFAASISDDGAQVAFLYGPNRQVHMIRSDGTGLRQVTNYSEAVTEVALSGDGSVAFAVTATNRIVRIDIASAQSTDIVPPTPYTNVPAGTGLLNAFVTGYRIQVSRGSVTQVTGSGFAAETRDALPPFPLALGGVELHIGGASVPIAGISPMSISYPAAWDLPDSPVDVEVWVSSAAGSPFVPGFEVELAAPNFYYLDQSMGPFLLIAVHQDFASLVTPASPARPSEIIHVYAKDLGPVNPVPPAGLPAPLSCTLQADASPASVPVGILFAGLAPELLNVFQVDVRLPASFQGNPSALRCNVGDPALGYFVGGYLTVSVAF